jgi:hypothetical protein
MDLGLTVLVVFAWGSITLITLGLARVLAIRKNSNRKNMISFSDDDSTSASSRLRLPIFMMLGLNR